MRRLTVLLATMVLLATIGAGAWAPSRQADAQWTSRRIGEVVAVSGASLEPFQGAATDQLWVWTWQDQWILEPSQLDERDGAGDYVTAEDGTLDANDEVVFQLNFAGDEAPEGEWPPGIERTHPWAHVAVTDPLDDTLAAHMYVFRSRGGPEIAVEPMLRFDETLKEVTTNQYVLGMADPDTDGYVGIKRLSLFESTTDYLDRMKIRASVTILGTEQQMTEESLALLGQLGIEIGGLTPDPVIVGPVRAVFDAGGEMIANPWTVDLSLDGLSAVGGGGFFELGSMRVSLDLSADAVPVTYADPNLAAPIAVDGSPDEVAETPLPRWREMAFDEGRVVVMSSPDEGAEASAYYKDDNAADPDDTGDGMSYGDNGVVSNSVDGFVASGFPGRIFVVQPDWPYTPDELAQGIDNPVQVSVTYGAEPPTPTPGGPTFTPYPTETSVPPTPTMTSPTTTAVPPGSAAPAYLPVAYRGL